MSGKDYRLAKALRWTRPSSPECPPFELIRFHVRDCHTKALKYQTEVWRLTVVSVADALAVDNGRFDRDRFYRAAGFDS